MSEASIELLRNDPVYFAEKILNIRLHEGQKRILQCEDRFLAIRAARRFGKSYLFSVFAAWMACTRPNYRIVCISKSLRQASEMFNTIYRIVSNSVMANSITRDTRTRIEFTNGSIIESLPGQSYDSIRGITINLVLIDEAAYVPEELFVVLYPTIITTKGKVVLISTPAYAAGEFYRACKHPDSEYTEFHMTHDDAVFADGTPFVDREELKRECIRCGGDESPQWIREYLADFTDAEGGWFNLLSIEDALCETKWLEFGLPDRRYVIGADVAKERDFTVIVTLDCTNPDHLELVHYKRFNGKEPDDVMYELYDEAVRFNVQRPFIDETGIGKPIVDYLRTRYPKIRWTGQNFNSSSKVELMTDLDLAMNRRILKIPDDEDIRKELVSFHYEQSNSGNLKIYGEGAHDDFPVAIALAVRAAGVIKQGGSKAIGTRKGILKSKKKKKSVAGSRKHGRTTFA